MSERLPDNILAGLQHMAKGPSSDPHTAIATYALALIEELEAELAEVRTSFKRRRTVADLISAAIEQAGGDGLVYPGLECGCGKDELMACGEPDLTRCVLAKVARRPNDCGDWYVPFGEPDHDPVQAT